MFFVQTIFSSLDGLRIEIGLDKNMTSLPGWSPAVVVPGTASDQLSATQWSGSPVTGHIKTAYVAAKYCRFVFLRPILT